MRIAFLGTRGIPNCYGGFEQFVTYIAPMLAQRGHRVTVYNSSLNRYRGKFFKDVRIIIKPDPQNIMGPAGQFIYDLLCILDARKNNFDLIFQLGYTSSSIWSFLFPGNSVLATNMDGMEWKRSKYHAWVQWFLKRAESWAVKRSDLLIADSFGIRDYLVNKYGFPVVYIPYGANEFESPDAKVPGSFGLRPFEYDLMIARCIPENNIEMILKGYLQADSERKLVIIGMDKSAYANYLIKQFSDPHIVFENSLYAEQILNNLRYYSNIYFHGHSAGGTNPSLLEAIAARCLVAAHDNIFNREVLENNAYYFKNEREVAELIKMRLSKSAHSHFLENNSNKIKAFYNWENILNLIDMKIISTVTKSPRQHQAAYLQHLKSLMSELKV